MFLAAESNQSGPGERPHREVEWSPRLRIRHAGIALVALALPQVSEIDHWKRKLVLRHHTLALPLTLHHHLASQYLVPTEDLGERALQRGDIEPAAKPDSRWPVVDAETRLHLLEKADALLKGRQWRRRSRRTTRD